MSRTYMFLYDPEKQSTKISLQTQLFFIDFYRLLELKGTLITQRKASKYLQGVLMLFGKNVNKIYIFEKPKCILRRGATQGILSSVSWS